MEITVVLLNKRPLALAICSTVVLNHGVSSTRGQEMEVGVSLLKCMQDGGMLLFLPHIVSWLDW
jgi:hypothetical protein